jgi:hypothetical protein
MKIRYEKNITARSNETSCDHFCTFHETDCGCER